MTSTEPALWTSAPTTGFKMPVIAKTIAMKFRAMENVKLHLMVTIIRFGQAQQVGQLLDVVVDQRDVGGVHGDVASHAAHGDAHIRLFQGGCIVDAVPDHADMMSLLLVGVDPVQFVLRQAARMDFVDVRAAGRCDCAAFSWSPVSRTGVTPASFDGTDHRFGVLRTQRIGERKESREGCDRSP